MCEGLQLEAWYPGLELDLAFRAQFVVTVVHAALSICRCGSSQMSAKLAS